MLGAVDGGQGLSARAVHERLTATGLGCDLTTVHRILHRLRKAGVLDVVPCGRVVGYRLTGWDTVALTCVQCGRATTLSAGTATALLREAEGASFALGGVVAGRCAACA